MYNSAIILCKLCHFLKSWFFIILYGLIYLQTNPFEETLYFHGKSMNFRYMDFKLCELQDITFQASITRNGFSDLYESTFNVIK